MTNDVQDDGVCGSDAGTAEDSSPDDDGGWEPSNIQIFSGAFFKKEIHFRKPLSPHTKWTHSKLFHFYIQVPPQLLIMDPFFSPQSFNLAWSHLFCRPIGTLLRYGKVSRAHTRRAESVSWDPLMPGWVHVSGVPAKPHPPSSLSAY